MNSGTSSELLSTNRLNELIHKKLKFRPSIMFQRFCSEIRYLHPLCLEPFDNQENSRKLSDGHRTPLRARIYPRGVMNVKYHV